MTEGMTRQGFDIDLRNAQVREESLARHLREATFELKTDYGLSGSGNHYCELRDGGRASGLNVTEAAYWVVEFLPDNYLMVPVPRVREIVPDGRPVNGGDNNRTSAVLIPWNMWRKPSPACDWPEDMKRGAVWERDGDQERMFKS